MVFGLQLAGDGGAQRVDAGGGRVPRPVLNQGAHRSVLDGVGSFEEWLSAVKGVDRFACRAQFEDLVANLHDVGEADFVEAPGEMDRFCFPYCCL